MIQPNFVLNGARALSQTRRGFLGRLGGAVVGAAAAQTLFVQTKAWACGPPACCTGSNACGCYGCSCSSPGSGGCCWNCSPVGTCRTYQCCDNSCNGQACICAYVICNCC